MSDWNLSLTGFDAGGDAQNLETCKGDGSFCSKSKSKGQTDLRSTSISTSRHMSQIVETENENKLDCIRKSWKNTTFNGLKRVREEDANLSSSIYTVENQVSGASFFRYCSMFMHSELLMVCLIRMTWPETGRMG